MFFSVIVPIYNVEKFLEQCIVSILESSFRDFELILVDDGSTDKCSQICDRYVSMDSRVIALHKKNGGLVSARKAGLRKARGKYILYVDGDDYIGRNWMNSIYETINKYSYPDVVACGYTIPNNGEERKVINNFPDGLYMEADLCDIKENLLFDNRKTGAEFSGVLMSICTKAISKKCLEKVQYQVPESISVGEDTAVTVPLIRSSRSLAINNIAEYYYRINPTSIMHTFRESESGQLKLLLNYLYSSTGNEMNDQISIYGYSRYLSLVFKACYANPCFGKAMSFLKEYLIEDKEFRKILCKTETKNMRLRYRVLKVILNSRLYCLIWLWCRLQDRRGKLSVESVRGNNSEK